MLKNNLVGKKKGSTMVSQLRCRPFGCVILLLEMQKVCREIGNGLCISLRRGKADEEVLNSEGRCPSGSDEAPHARGRSIRNSY